MSTGGVSLEEKVGVDEADDVIGWTLAHNLNVVENLIQTSCGMCGAQSPLFTKLSFRHGKAPNLTGCRSSLATHITHLCKPER